MITKIPNTPLTLESQIEEESILPGMQNLKHEVYWNGKKAPNIVLQNAQGKRLSILYSLSSDLKYCAECLSRLDVLPQTNEVDVLLERSLLIAFGVTYARCFNSGRRNPLKKNKVFDGKPENRKLHEEIILLRNTYLAHSGGSYFECSSAVAVFNPDLTTTEDMIVLNIARSGSGVAKSKYKKYLAHIDIIRSYVGLEMEKLEKHIISVFNSAGIDELNEVLQLQKLNK